MIFPHLASVPTPTRTQERTPADTHLHPHRYTPTPKHADIQTPRNPDPHPDTHTYTFPPNRPHRHTAHSLLFLTPPVFRNPAEDKSAGAASKEFNNWQMITMQLKAMQTQMNMQQSSTFNHRFAGQQPSIEDTPRLGNGAVLEILKPPQAAMRKENPTEPMMSAEPAQEPKRARVSVEAATKTILAGLGARDAEIMAVDDDSDADESSPHGGEEKAGKRKENPTRKDKAKTNPRGGKVCVRYEDVPSQNMFGCFYNKMMVKKFMYKGKCKKQTSERQAKDWCKNMCLKHDWGVPPERK